MVNCPITCWFPGAVVKKIPCTVEATCKSKLLWIGCSLNGPLYLCITMMVTLFVGLIHHCFLSSRKMRNVCAILRFFHLLSIYFQLSTHEVIALIVQNVFLKAFYVSNIVLSCWLKSANLITPFQSSYHSWFHFDMTHTHVLGTQIDGVLE